MADFERESETDVPDVTWSRSRLSEETDESRNLRAARMAYSGVRDAERVAGVIYGSIFRRIKVHIVGLENDLQWVSAVEAMWSAGVVVVLEDISPTEIEDVNEPNMLTQAQILAVDLVVLVGKYENDPVVLALCHRYNTPVVPLRALVQS